MVPLVVTVVMVVGFGRLIILACFRNMVLHRVPQVLHSLEQGKLREHGGKAVDTPVLQEVGQFVDK